MTITSINHNPGNESKYARRRSIWKGRHNQLREAIARLQGTHGVHVHEYRSTSAFGHEWHVSFSAQRMEPTKRTQILGRWEVDGPSEKILHACPGSLRADMRTLWKDFIVVVGRRIGKSTGPGSDTFQDAYHGESVLVFAPGPASFDLIVSKYGYGDDLKRNHHFFQWQARDKSFQGLVHVDDYQGEEGLTFYVVS